MEARVKLSRRFTVLFLVQLILCTGAFYANAGEEPERKWTSYMRERDRSIEYFFDKEAMVKSPQNTLNVWRKRVFAEGAAQKELITFDLLACDFREEYRTMQLTVVYRDGTSKTFDRPTPWIHIYTNSPEQYLVDEYCKKTPVSTE